MPLQSSGKCKTKTHHSHLRRREDVGGWGWATSSTSYQCGPQQLCPCSWCEVEWDTHQTEVRWGDRSINPNSQKQTGAEHNLSTNKQNVVGCIQTLSQSSEGWQADSRSMTSQIFLSIHYIRVTDPGYVREPRRRHLRTPHSPPQKLAPYTLHTSCSQYEEVWVKLGKEPQSRNIQFYKPTLSYMQNHVWPALFCNCWSTF